jgi:hypothetical protein
MHSRQSRLPATHRSILLLKSLRASTQLRDVERLRRFGGWAATTAHPAAGEGQCNQCLHARRGGEAGDCQRPHAGSETADWVRIRREFSLQALFSTVQYSFSVDAKNMVETLVFRVRDPKDLMQVSIEDSASAVTTPSAMLGTSTPASRIKLERFGKSSVVLARCSGTEAGPPPDQTAYEPLFQNASSIVTKYRSLLGAKGIVPDELTRVRDAPSAKSQSLPASKRREREHK